MHTDISKDEMPKFDLPVSFSDKRRLRILEQFKSRIHHIKSGEEMDFIEQIYEAGYSSASKDHDLIYDKLNHEK